MASSFRNCGFVLSVLAAAALPVRAAEPRASQPVSVEAESSDVDYRSSRVVFNRVRITQGDLVVEAAARADELLAERRASEPPAPAAAP